jgi:potassium efflux system protein
MFGAVVCLVLTPGLSPNAPGADADPPAQSTAPPGGPESASGGISAGAIQARLKSVESNRELPETDRATLVDLYNRILQQLKLSEAARARIEDFTKAVENAPRELQRLKKLAAEATESHALTIPPETTLAEAKLGLSQAESKLIESQNRLAELQSEPKRRGDRRIEIPRRQAELRKQIDELEKQLAGKSPDAEPDGLPGAAQLLLEARKQAADQELRALQLELAAYEATSELIVLQRDLAVPEESHAQQAVKQWEDAVHDLRRREAQAQTHDAERTVAQSHPAVKALAFENSKFASEREDRAREIERVTELAKQIESQTQNLTVQFNKVQQRARRVGIGQTIGLLLRKHLENLPNLREHRRHLGARQDEITKLSLRMLELEDDRAELADSESVVASHVAKLRLSVNEVELPLIEDELRQLVQTKREILDSLIADTNRYLDKLVEINTRESQLIAQAEEFKTYADENVLWIRSAGIPHVADWENGVAALRWIVSPKGWSQIFQTVFRDFREYPAAYLLFTALVSGFGALQHFCRRRLPVCGQNASRRQAIQYRLTAEALLLTAILAFEWPFVMWLCGWRLLDLAVSSEFVVTVGTSLQGLAALLLTVEVPLQVSRKEGLGEAHFGWSARALRSIRRNLRWLMGIGMPAAALVLMTEAQSDESYKSSLGRAAYFIVMILASWTAYRTWHPPGGLLQELLSRESDVQWRRFVQICHGATFSAPVALALLATAGYYYTAVRLTWWMIWTMWLLFGVVVVHSMMLRWLLLAYRELAIQRARERRAAEAAAAAAAADSDAKPPLADVAIPEPSVSLSDVNLQTRNLLRLAVFAVLFIGAWLIWSGVLPALSIFKRVELWPEFSVIKSGAESSEGAITLAALLLAAIIGLTTLAAARNIPGLLELTVLRRLSMEASARYAIASVSRYLIVMTGTVAAFGRLGIGWSQVQWLAAAVSVGLGFGLQEIFANFVSGLMLLFERPIRIGDIVSVGDVTGKVSRIRIRATTITDWDMRELVVPNKELITGRVINWTLSDTTARMTIHVGAAYGSNPDQVRQILLQVAREHPQVLSDPAPHALFDEFGESSINFTLRVYLTSLDVLLQVRHDLHTAIIAAFHDAGLEIPFPQRDLRLRDSPELIAALETTVRNSSSNGR